VALEGYLQQYPDSVVKVDSLELLLVTYQKLGNLQKMTDTANRLLAVDPANLRALVFMTYLKRNQFEQGGTPASQAMADMQQFAQRGVQAMQTAPKPDGMSQADFDKLKTASGAIFNGALGLAALQNKDYATAQQRLQDAVNANPANLRDVYPLALAYLQAPQPIFLQGLWYIARAAELATENKNAEAQQQFTKYGRSFYIKYHGNDQGWSDVLKLAAANATPPADFKIAPRPTPADEARDLVATTAVKDMTFDQFQLIFTSGNQEAADKVWADLKDKPIAFEATVVTAGATKLTLAATADDIDKKTADVALTMVTAIPRALIPKIGATAKVEGTPTAYTTQPFMITMVKGFLVGTPPKPPAARRRAVAQ